MKLRELNYLSNENVNDVKLFIAFNDMNILNKEIFKLLINL